MQPNIQIDPQRLWDAIMETAEFGKTPKGGVRRLTPPFGVLPNSAVSMIASQRRCGSIWMFGCIVHTSLRSCPGHDPRDQAGLRMKSASMVEAGCPATSRV